MTQAKKDKKKFGMIAWLYGRHRDPLLIDILENIRVSAMARKEVDKNEVLLQKLIAKIELNRQSDRLKRDSRKFSGDTEESNERVATAKEVVTVIL